MPILFAKKKEDTLCKTKARELSHLERSRVGDFAVIDLAFAVCSPPDAVKTTVPTHIYIYMYTRRHIHENIPLGIHSREESPFLPLSSQLPRRITDVARRPDVRISNPKSSFPINYKLRDLIRIPPYNIGRVCSHLRFCNRRSQLNLDNSRTFPLHDCKTFSLYNSRGFRYSIRDLLYSCHYLFACRSII